MGSCDPSSWTEPVKKDHEVREKEISDARQNRIEQNKLRQKQQNPTTNDVPCDYYRIGVSLKAAAVVGVGLEAGITFDTAGNYGFYGSFSVGVGVQLGMSDPKNIVVKQILDSFLGGGLSGASGTIDSANGSSTTIDGGAGVMATWDMNNNNGVPSGLGGIGFGGGVWKNWSGAWNLSKLLRN